MTSRARLKGRTAVIAGLCLSALGAPALAQHRAAFAPVRRLPPAFAAPLGPRGIAFDAHRALPAVELRLALPPSLTAAPEPGPSSEQPADAAPRDLDLSGHAFRAAAGTLLGQELTIVPPAYLRPVQVAEWIAARAGGTAVEHEPNGRSTALTGDGIWVVTIDGRVPGGPPIIEAATPPLAFEAEARLAQLLPGLHGLGAPVSTLGGGHLHVDGTAFLSRPGLLERFLAFYLYVEPALLSRFRHPARAHAARGYCEFPESPALRSTLLAAGRTPSDGLREALESFLSAHSLRREMALNLRSLSGVFSGNKRSKGTLELRLFDTPKDAAELMAQHATVRLLLAAAYGVGPAPDPQATPVADIEIALAALRRGATRSSGNPSR